jgi:3D (Asp-Asp-Asp) domain-containing protein
MTQKRLKTIRRARLAQFAVQCACFAMLAGLTAVSAMLAKRSTPAPALVALDEAPGLILATNESGPDLPGAAALEARVTPAVAIERDLDDLPEIVAEPAPSPRFSEEIYTPPEGYARYFNGRPLRAARTITMVVTAYSPDARSCPGTDDGYTATNHSVWTNAMRMVAADTDLLPFGSLVSVPGYADGEVVPVLDRGGAIKGRRLDVLYPTHEIARKWGRQKIKVTIWEYADGKGTQLRGAR